MIMLVIDKVTFGEMVKTEAGDKQHYFLSQAQGNIFNILLRPTNIDKPTVMTFEKMEQKFV